MLDLHKGGGENENRLFPVKEPPGGSDNSRRQINKNKYYNIISRIFLNFKIGSEVFTLYRRIFGLEVME